ncbi:MAG TPA: DNA polymerase III subunit alpha, partial [Pseudomonas pachastrellae]|nr:DNA polymerase III subunit alpha [Halopseudomonas pachastrellae]
ARQRILDLKPSRESQTIAGLVFDMRVMKNKRGDKVGFVTLDDRSARIEVSLFSEAYNAAQALLQKDAMLVVEGEVAVDDFSGGMRVRAKRVMSLEEARTGLLDSVRVNLDGARHDAAALSRMAGLLQQYRGGCPVTVEYQRADAAALLRLGDEWRVEPADDLLQSLRDQLGKDSVSLHYR